MSEAYSRFATVTGFDTLPLARIRDMDGLSVLQAMIAGDLPAPPIARTLGFILDEVGEGRAVFKGMPAADYLNPLGTIHGGWAGTLLDSALGCAVHSSIRAGEAYTTVEYKVNLVRPIMPDTGEVTCEGVLIHRGSRIATSEATLKTADGKLLAHGSETCIIFPMKA
ncbi:PaaI family thioesterase [Microbaculum marinum]|uniref:PaaI family thioesterase n=1 Tax=Microbaculum marinum TaxID=1764581 RepID=A0AAW9RUG2_9HYPH